MMYITNMTHVLDDEGNITTKGTKAGRLFASFLAMVIDSITQEYSEENPVIRCYKKNCSGFITTYRSLPDDDILWYCSECNVEGVISHWRETKWNNKENEVLENFEIDQQVVAWMKRLESELTFPFTVKPQPFIKNDFPDESDMVITRIHHFVDDYGLIVELQQVDQTHYLPLCNLEIADRASDNTKLINEFLSWWYSTEDREL